MDIKKQLKRILLKNKRWISMLVLMIGIGMMIYGSNRGEVSIVLNKAITICLECIGLG